MLTTAVPGPGQSWDVRIQSRSCQKGDTWKSRNESPEKSGFRGSQPVRHRVEPTIKQNGMEFPTDNLV